MRRIKKTVICMSLLATLFLVGCVCPSGYYTGMNRYGSSPGICYDSSCDPCGVDAGCGGVIEYNGNPCMPQTCVPRVVDCRTSFANLGNGVCLIGRGILDVTAAPFIVIGNMLSSGCRYDVSVNCGEIYYGNACSSTEMVHPCSPCGPVGTSGCESCANGYSEGIQYNSNVLNQPMTYLPRKNAVVQATYQEPIAPAIRFVQPR